jgi:hypothetical protein
VQKTKSPLVGLAQSGPVFFRLVEKDKRTLNVGAQERVGGNDGTVNVALSGKMDDGPRTMSLEKRPDQFGIANVALDKNVLGVFIERSQIATVAGIG